MKKFVLFLFILSQSAFALLYTKEDLQILYKDKSSIEYIQHALDIRPTERDENWKKMTKEMAYLLLEKLIKKKKITSHHRTLLNKLEKITFLNDDQIFLMKKGILSASQLNHCTENCKNYLSEYIKYRKYYKESDLEIYYKFKDKFQEAKALLKEVTTDKNSDLFCKRDRVKFYFEKMLKEELHEISEIYNTNGIESFVSKDCLTSMKDHLINSLIKEHRSTSDKVTNERYIEFVTKMMVTSKILTTSEEDFLLTLYVLGNPIQGKLFNLSWTRVENLSEDYKRRAKVLKKLMSLDPLSDRILEISDRRKKVTIVNHFNKNFPEYFKEYSKKCVHFLEGKGNFPLGNPTINCDKLFSLNIDKKWISDRIRTRYSSAKKL